MNFNEYIIEKEEKEFDEINEDLTIAAMTILGIPTAALLVAYGGTLLVKGYSKFLISLLNKIIYHWKEIFNNTKNIGKEDVIKVIRENKQKPLVKNEIKKIDENEKKYSKELAKVLRAIETKDFNKAKDEFKKLDKKIINNPDVQKVIIAEVSRILKEPPLYVTSPGNKAYQAVKKIINIRTARASAEASKLAIEKGLK